MPTQLMPTVLGPTLLGPTLLGPALLGPTLLRRTSGLLETWHVCLAVAHTCQHISYASILFMPTY